MTEKANITHSQETKLFEHAEAIKNILGEHATELSEQSVKTPGAELAQLFRPFLVSMLSASDKREGTWSVEVFMWAFDIDPKIDGSLWAQNDKPEQVRGLSGVSDLVREYLEEFHDGIEPGEIEGLDNVEHPFSQLELRRRMASIRPAIHRGGGHCSTRWKYSMEPDKFMLQIDIARVD